jgi:hypothetical protein
MPAWMDRGAGASSRVLEEKKEIGAKLGLRSGRGRKVVRVTVSRGRCDKSQVGLQARQWRGERPDGREQRQKELETVNQQASEPLEWVPAVWKVGLGASGLPCDSRRCGYGIGIVAKREKGGQAQRGARRGRTRMDGETWPASACATGELSACPPEAEQILLRRGPVAG